MNKSPSSDPFHIVAIVQARTASSRLPNKVLLEIGGEPMLVQVIERVRKAQTVDEVLVATTNDPSDDPILELCARRGYACYRGSQYDVLDRYYQAARAAKAEVIVRITADCPLIDPEVIDKTVLAFLGASKPGEESLPYDFAANRLPPPWKRTYPIGLDTEVCSMQALKRAWQEARLAYQREHVMPYLYDEEGRFRVLVVDHEVDYGAVRLTVDTPEDLALMRAIYARFPGRTDFSWLEVLDLLRSEPALATLNAAVQHKSLQDVDERAMRSKSDNRTTRR